MQKKKLLAILIISALLTAAVPMIVLACEQAQKGNLAQPENPIQLMVMSLVKTQGGNEYRNQEGILWRYQKGDLTQTQEQTKTEKNQGDDLIQTHKQLMDGNREQNHDGDQDGSQANNQEQNIEGDQTQSRDGIQIQDQDQDNVLTKDQYQERKGGSK